MENLIGKTLGNYRIESVIGTGGMGQVFRAAHIHLGREAAIKVLHANLAAEPGFQARFLQEARAIASLKHPNIVEVHDFGEQDGSLYLIMELIDGGSLRQLLLTQKTAQAGLPLWTGIDLVRQIADGLALAHVRGMVHRDIKPDNLLLSDTRGGNPVIKITDFGLVRLAESGVMTATGAVLGTAAYMSPEQCQGVELDGRSDLYSLGVVLYEVATGYVPFQAKTLSAAVYNHVQVAPPPPRTVKPDLPLELDQIILRCLAKRPADRYGSAAELSSALRTVLANQGAIKPHRGQAPEPAADKPDVTVVQPRSRRDAQAPPSSLGSDSVLGTASGVPRIRLHDQTGKVLQTAELTAAGVTIGRTADNQLSYESTELSRSHLRIQLEGQRVTVTDLGSANGTYLDGVRLLPQVAQVWDGSQPLRLGSSLWLALEPALALSPPATDGPRSSRSNKIGVALDSKTMVLTPGQPAKCKVALVNLEEIVDHISVAVAGVPEEWVEGTGKEVQLNPGAQTTVLLTILVPQEHTSRAGDYDVTIRVRSRENPGDSGSAEATWTVLPFAAMSVGISPVKASGRKEASYQVNLHNEGNAAGEFELSGFDEEGELAFLFAANTLNPQATLSQRLEAGGVSSTTLKVQKARRWIGAAQPYRFNVRARERKVKDPQQATAKFIHRALLPTWVLAALPLLLIGLGFVAYLALQPQPVDSGQFPQPTPTPTVKEEQGSGTAAPSPNADEDSSPTPEESPSPSPEETESPSPVDVEQAASDEAVLASLIQIEDEWMEANRDGNREKLNLILAEDFQDQEGQNKEDYLRTHTPETKEWKFLGLKPTRQGDHAILRGTRVEGEKDVIDFTHRFIFRDGRWQVQRTTLIFR
jgi:eukaryotic-like serine/threonine-protein kinase